MSQGWDEPRRTQPSEEAADEVMEGALRRRLPAVAEWLTPRVGGLDGPLRARVISGGRSNPTYVVEDDERAWVLRGPPLGHVLETAHDMGREYRVLSALWHSPVPVPRTVGLCRW